MKKRLILSIIVMTAILCQGAVSGQNYAVDVTVALDGSGNFTSIQKAIESCKAYPDRNITIHIKNGVYKEKVLIPRWNPHIHLVGENRDSTILQFDDYFGRIGKGPNSTFYTATLRIDAADITCRNLTIENSAGPVGQALALSVSGDRCQVRNCRILGNQDTFFATGEGTRVYVSDCYITGTTDFIFGDATVLFSHCTLYGKADSYVTAASTNKAQKYGFVFRQCQLSAAPGVKKLLLGRPWRSYAKTVYIQCRMSAAIAPTGWDNWRNPGNESTAYYAEYASSGPGAQPDKRVGWAHELSAAEALNFSLKKVFGQGQPWVPAP